MVQILLVFMLSGGHSYAEEAGGSSLQKVIQDLEDYTKKESRYASGVAQKLKEFSQLTSDGDPIRLQHAETIGSLWVAYPAQDSLSVSVRQEASRIFARMGTHESLKGVVRILAYLLLEEIDQFTLEHIVEALGFIQADPEFSALTLFRYGLDMRRQDTSETKRLQWRAMESLWKLAPLVQHNETLAQKVSPVLIQILNKTPLDDSHQRTIALEGIAAYERDTHGKTVPLCESILLNHSDVILNTKARAARILANMGEISILIKGAESGNLSTQIASIYGIAELGPQVPEAREQMLKFFSSQNADIRKATSNALGEVAGWESFTP